MASIKITIPPFIGIEFSKEDIHAFRKSLGKKTAALFKDKGLDLVGCYQLIAKHSGKCLDVDGYKFENCANVWQYDMNGGDNQKWVLVKATDGYYYIFAKHSGKCLDVEGWKTENCANVWQYAFHGGDNQQWELRDAGDGFFHILAKHSGKCLDVEGWKTENCANVWQYDLHGGDNQKWKLKPIEE